MQLSEMLPYLGKVACWRIPNHEGLTVDVQVKDAKTAYGRVLLLIEPVAGAGEIWVDWEKVTLLQERA